MLDARCACNSRLNLVRLFVNPPHPARARTPPCGYVCARLRLCARLSVRLCVHACAHSRFIGCGGCLTAYRAVVRSRFVLCRCASAGRACVFCSRLPLLPLASLWMLWPAPACSRPPLCRAARSLRVSLPLTPRFTRGSVTIVCYNQSSALQVLLIT